MAKEDSENVERERPPFQLNEEERDALKTQGRLKYFSYADDPKHTALLDGEYWFHKGETGLYYRLLDPDESGGVKWE